MGVEGSGLSREQWFRLPLKLRQQWWRETDYGKKQPSEGLRQKIKEALSHEQAGQG